jgi:hypothetical protein
MARWAAGAYLDQNCQGVHRPKPVRIKSNQTRFRSNIGQAAEDAHSCDVHA